MNAPLAPPSSRFKPVAAGARLSEQVAEALAEEIRAGSLRAGEKLPPEIRLVEQFGVSRTVVREAVSRLKSLGLVDSRQGSGVYVCDVDRFAPLRFDPKRAASLDAVIQLEEVRRGLEAEVAALAAERSTAEDIRKIRASIAALDRVVAEGRNGVDEDLRFHRSIAEAACNPFLMGVLDYLGQFLHGAIRVTRANEARREDFAQQVRREHQAIIEAIEAGSPSKARQAAARHVNNAIRRLKDADPAFWTEQGTELVAPLIEGLDRLPQPPGAAGR